ncbi:hypothetical protein C3941_08565 [Kaistia algarum]|uniref:PepSY domain-containing protein n=1 Tax=Kaistia algarum TaxID=2083279 RepID=UPI000CE76F90|nr:hypothetical protein [Kaistia algarum]MCX5512109.1 hypothetical protein [Kaistia algarum]PPE80222.1 hypothetical protein C3941_08565 [Kaistia algarum]
MSKPFLKAAAILCCLASMSQPAFADGCLSQSEARQAVQSGQAVSLSQLRSGIPGEVLSAQLCRSGGGLVYVVSVLADGGAVKRLRVDAQSGAVSGN